MAKEKKEIVESITKADKSEKVECEDKKCPFHGQLSVRGRHFEGTVKKIIGSRAVIEFGRLIHSKKYERFAKAKTKLHAYIPSCLRKTIALGDSVRIRECRPLSKILHFIVMEKIK